MKIWTSEHVFQHPWQTVAHAAWRKYPNPINPAVTGLDVLDREVGSDGVLRTKRVLKSEWSIPGWVTKLIGLDNPTFAHEYSEVNPGEQTMTLKSTNLNCTRFVSIDERLLYKPHPEDPGKTLLEQTAVISVHGVPLVNYLENLMASKMSSNALKGREAMEWVIGNIKRECEEISQKITSDYQELSHKLTSECEEISQKITSEYQELSHKLTSEYEEISQNVRHGMDELRRGIDDFSCNIGVEQNSTPKILID